MKVVGVKYEIRPPRLVCVKLAFIDGDSGRTTGAMFTLKCVFNVDLFCNQAAESI